MTLLRTEVVCVIVLPGFALCGQTGYWIWCYKMTEHPTWDKTKYVGP